jgi:hypothetical protein
MLSRDDCVSFSFSIVGGCPAYPTCPPVTKNEIPLSASEEHQTEDVARVIFEHLGLKMSFFHKQS